MGQDAMILVFRMLSFKPTYSLCSFTFIKRLFSSSLSAITVVLSVYLSLLLFLQAILISACASPSLVFCMMYSAAAAAAKSHQSCPTLCYPIDGSSPGSPVPGILQAGTLEWAAMYSAFKLNKQGDNIQPWRTPFLIGTSLFSMSSSNCCFLTGIQISQEADQVVWYSHLFQNFPQQRSKRKI